MGSMSGSGRILGRSGVHDALRAIHGLIRGTREAATGGDII